MKCRICGSEKTAPFLDLGNQPLANRLLSKEDLDRPEPRYPLGLEYCPSCGFVQLTHVVPPEEMFLDYPYVTGTSSETREHFARLASQVDVWAVQGPPLRDKHLVVDIGSNDGTLLQGFKSLGWQTLGIEPAENLAAIARRNGIDTVVAFLNADTVRGIVEQHGNAMAVTATNVLSHVDEVYKFLNYVKALLAGKGVFVVEVYDLVSLLENGAVDQCYHEHLSYFTARTLAFALATAGLQLWHVEKVPVHGGSLRAYASLPGVHHVRDSVRAVLDAEPAAWTLFDRLEAFRERVEKVKKDFQGFLNEADEDGLRVVGYAAAAKATMLCNYVGIGPEDLPYIVDKNPMKQGKYLPGVRIPIVGPEVLERDPPDVLFLFSWNLADEIVREWKPKLPNTRFLVAVPELREVG